MTREYCHHCKQLIDKTSLAQCNYNLRRYGPACSDGEDDSPLSITKPVKASNSKYVMRGIDEKVEEKKKDASPQSV